MTAENQMTGLVLQLLQKLNSVKTENEVLLKDQYYIMVVGCNRCRSLQGRYSVTLLNNKT